MRDESTSDPAPRHVLITFHGTLVYYDVDAGQLRHAAIGEREANVYAMRQGSDVLLAWWDGERVRPFSEIDPRVLPAIDVRHAYILKAQIKERGRVSLQANGHYLCAENGGAVEMSRLTAKSWEMFLLVDLEDYSRLAFVLTNRWLSPVTRELIGPASNYASQNHMVRIGRANLKIEDAIAAINMNSSGAIPRELYLRFDDWKLEHYFLFRPLAYFVAYGRQEIFDCAEIAIRSLFEFGEYDGHVLLITSADHADFYERFPESIRQNMSVVSIPADDVLDYTLSRYKIVQDDLFKYYQPAIYIDIDIVCDVTLFPVLRDAVLSPKLHICPEETYRLGHAGDFFGRSLLIADDVAFDGDQPGISSGMFAFRDADDHKIPFRLLVDAAYEHALSIEQRDAFLVYDQVYFNYMIQKMNNSSASILGGRVKYHIGSDPLLTATVGRGMVHFAGGVGNMTPKLQHMSHYAEVVRADRATKVELPEG